MKQLLLLLISISAVFAYIRVRRLIDGENAYPGQFPYIVSLQKIQNKAHFCGGSILNERYILTAAHCITGEDPKNITILTGSQRKSIGGEYYLVDKLVYHQDYNLQNVLNDIGIIKVHKNIIFNKFTQPIPLLTDANKVPCNVNLTVCGFGRIGVKIKIKGVEEIVTWNVDTLQFFEVTQITHKLCKLIYSHIGLDNKKIIKVTDNTFCTMTRNGKGVCNGDSGSPAVYNGMLVGIVSWTIHCGLGVPEGYTNVTKYLNWINETMEDMNILPGEFNETVEDTNEFSEISTTMITELFNEVNTTVFPEEFSEITSTDLLDKFSEFTSTVLPDELNGFAFTVLPDEYNEINSTLKVN